MEFTWYRKKCRTCRQLHKRVMNFTRGAVKGPAQQKFRASANKVQNPHGHTVAEPLEIGVDFHTIRGVFLGNFAAKTKID